LEEPDKDIAKGYGDQYIKKCPDRTKEPRRGGPGRLFKMLVPTVSIHYWYIIADKNMVKSTEELSLETICRIAYDLKKQGKRVGLTHGAFDLFHYGHLYLLRQSFKKCDFLIVGVDGNKNIAKYKSYTRPIIDEKYRLQIVNELDCVGAAFINNWGIADKWIELDREIKPDVITAGARYGMGDGIRYEADRAKAKLYEFKQAFESTTGIIDRIIAKQEKLYPRRAD
jgi:glycerol-3-phosphate cytidylyltransferase